MGSISWRYVNYVARDSAFWHASSPTVVRELILPFFPSSSPDYDTQRASMDEHKKYLADRILSEERPVSDPHSICALCLTKSASHRSPTDS